MAKMLSGATTAEDLLHSGGSVAHALLVDDERNEPRLRVDRLVVLDVHIIEERMQLINVAVH